MHRDGLLLWAFLSDKGKKGRDAMRVAMQSGRSAAMNSFEVWTVKEPRLEHAGTVCHHEQFWEFLSWEQWKAGFMSDRMTLGKSYCGGACSAEEKLLHYMQKVKMNSECELKEPTIWRISPFAELDGFADMNDKKNVRCTLSCRIGNCKHKADGINACVHAQEPDPAYWILCHIHQTGTGMRLPACFAQEIQVKLIDAML
jgi:hypothetical protein